AEVPSAFAGFVRRIVVAEGETVPIGAVVALIRAHLDAHVHDDADPGPVAASAGPPGPDLEPVARSAPRGPDRTTGSGGKGRARAVDGRSAGPSAGGSAGPPAGGAAG